jgi:glycosyltransferase involved in cell wall biosynthesis
MFQQEKIKVFTDGSRGVSCQLDRIDEGLLANNCQFVNDFTKADLIYSNNYNENWQLYIDAKRKGSFAGCLIFNVLDIPSWNFPHSFDLKDLYDKLIQADYVTTISQYVYWQLIRYYKLSSHVIYNPIQDVTNELRLKGEKPYPHKAMLIGRLRDPSKRVSLAINALMLAGYKQEEVAVVGSENIGWGSYLGVLSGEELHKLYNSVDYVCMPSLGEGLGLPGVEALASGAIPVVCSDLTTFREFYSPFLGNYPNYHDIAFFIGRGRQYYIDNFGKEIDSMRENVLTRLTKDKVAQKIIYLYSQSNKK